MPGFARLASLLAGCTLPVIVLAWGRAEPAGPGVLHPPAAAPPGAAPAAGAPAAPAPPPLPAGVEALARGAHPALASADLLAARPETWPSACLGLAPAGAACAQAVTPGWVVTFLPAAGVPVAVHVGAGAARLAESP